MSNVDVLAALRRLRSNLASGQVDIDETYAEFERLTYLLADVARSDERTLVAFVNDIERIRFTLLPENQQAAVDEVLVRAQEVFEHYV